MKIRIRTWVKIVSVLILLITFFFIYSKYINTKGINIKEYPIIDNKLPKNFYGFKIVQISDIHYKVSTNKKDLDKIIRNINKLKPDIVIFSGDLFDNNIKYSDADYEDLKKLLKSINYTIGKYAIKGEQDKSSKWEEIMNDSEFNNITDNSLLIYNNDITPISLTGISKENLKKDLNTSDSNIYSILIMHNPDLVDKIDYNKFNLILAGHSHGGIVKLPFLGGIIKHSKYVNDYYKLNNSKLYVSSGIGTHKYKLRFLNKPSINFYRLRNK